MNPGPRPTRRSPEGTLASNSEESSNRSRGAEGCGGVRAGEPGTWVPRIHLRRLGQAYRGDDGIKRVGGAFASGGPIPIEEALPIAKQIAARTALITLITCCR